MLQMQPVTRLLPSPECESLGHSLHVAADVAPLAVEYLPPEHSEQAAEPSTCLYVPAKQALHSPPFGPQYPALQMQSLTLLLPTGDEVCAGHDLQVASEISPVPAEYLPREHALHADEPTTSLYVPASQAPHARPSGPVYPRLQVQLVMTLLPS